MAAAEVRTESAASPDNSQRSLPVGQRALPAFKPGDERFIIHRRPPRSAPGARRVDRELKAPSGLTGKAKESAPGIARVGAHPRADGCKHHPLASRDPHCIAVRSN